ncbi:MAG: sugar ABC transporter permease [Thermomicrobiales bacterium]
MSGLPVTDRTYSGAAIAAPTRTPLTWRIRKYLGFVFISPWLIAFLAFDLIPTASAFWYSFTDWNVISGSSNWVGTANYREMIEGDRLFWPSVRNTLYYVGVSVPLGIVAGFFLALLLNTKIRFQGAYRTLFYLPAVVPTVAATLLWIWVFDTRNGLLNRALGVVGVDPIRWLTSPDYSKQALIIMSLWSIGGSMVIYLAGLQSIPEDLYEAADVDGASWLSKTFRITIPLMTPTIFFNLLLGIIGSFQVFNAAFIMTGGGPVNSTRFYMLHLYETAFQDSRMGYACAMAVALFMVVLAVTLFVNWSSKRWVFYS